MRKFKRVMVPALAFAGALAVGRDCAEAGCVSKGGRGTGGSRDSATFQAWEAVLQATSWGSWAQFMGSGMKSRLGAGLQGQQHAHELQGRAGCSAPNA